MAEIDVKNISYAPKNYADWLICFDILKSRIIDKDELEFLKNGTCGDIETTISYFETGLIKTINLMIQKYIVHFKREINLCAIFNDYESMQRPYIVFAQRISSCLFFTELDFLRNDFRNELLCSVTQEITRLWRSMVESLYFQCVDGDSMLEDQLLMIKRIKLFPESESLIA